MERLSDYLESHHNGLFTKIFLAQTLEKELQQIGQGEVKVIIKAKTIQLTCQEAAYAQLLELHRLKITKLIQRLAKTKQANFTLKIRVSWSG